MAFQNGVNLLTFRLKQNRALTYPEMDNMFRLPNIWEYDFEYKEVYNLFQGKVHFDI